MIDLSTCLDSTKLKLINLKTRYFYLRDDLCAQSFYGLKLSIQIPYLSSDYEIEVHAVIDKFVEQLSILYENDELFNQLNKLNIIRFDKNNPCIDNIYSQVLDFITDLLKVDDSKRKDSFVEEILLMTTLAAFIKSNKRPYFISTINNLRHSILNECIKNSTKVV